MARKSKNIYKRADGRWEARYPVARSETGKIIYRSVYGKTYTIAKEKMEIAVRNADSYRPKVKGMVCKVSDFCGEWLGTVRINCKKSTFVKYENVCNKYILPRFGNTNIGSVTTLAAEEYFLALVSEKKLAPKTVRDIVSVMKLIFAYADKHGGVINCNLSAITIKCIMYPRNKTGV